MAEPNDTIPPGMRTYLLGVFRRVPGRPEIDDAEADRIQRAHVANNRRLRADGTILASGPFLEESELRGILLFSERVTPDRAREQTAHDPAIREGRLILDLYIWMTPDRLRSEPPSDPTLP
ncbi:MAG TPA: hypothetical protein VFF67_01270 [Thermoplasmata archaeon]|nr:hypothetical protein [Thermoplasmata archaeon]